MSPASFPLYRCYLLRYSDNVLISSIWYRSFVLLAGTVIALLVMVGGSIGLLYGIGSQDLPSVLTGGSAGGHKRE